MDQNTAPNDTSHELADDLLRGSEEIAEFIFGKRGGRRKIYYPSRSLAPAGLPAWSLPLCASLSPVAMDCRAGKPGTEVVPSVWTVWRRC